MNVTFHALLGIGGGIVLSGFINKRKSEKMIEREDGLPLVLGFAGGIVLHGVFDIMPHVYPIPSVLDVILASLLMGLVLLFVDKRFWLVIGLSWLGNIFPDLVDHGPDTFRMVTGWNVPRVDIFPWHWQRYLPHIFYKQSISFVLTVLAFWFSLGLLSAGLILNKKRIFKDKVYHKIAGSHTVSENVSD